MSEHKHQITLTCDQLRCVAGILDNASEHIAGDDRPDHGLGRLNRWRDTASRETLDIIYSAVGYLLRRAKECKHEEYGRD